MWEETTAARLRDAHRTRDTLIAHARLLQGGGLPKAAQDPEGTGMTGFPRHTEEEVRRLNRLQAEYFGKTSRSSNLLCPKACRNGSSGS